MPFGLVTIPLPMPVHWSWAVVASRVRVSLCMRPCLCVWMPVPCLCLCLCRCLCLLWPETLHLRPSLQNFVCVQNTVVKQDCFLKVALLQHLFTQVIPCPRSRGDPLYESCIWAQPCKYMAQLDVLVLMKRIVEHFASSVLAIPTTRSLDTVRLIVWCVHSRGWVCGHVGALYVPWFCVCRTLPSLLHIVGQMLLLLFFLLLLLLLLLKPAMLHILELRCVPGGTGAWGECVLVRAQTPPAGRLCGRGGGIRLRTKPP